MNKTSLPLILAAAIATAFLTLSAGYTQPAVDDAEDIEHPVAATKRHEKVARVVTTLFEQSHYRRSKIDDTLSAEIFKRYLDALDGNRFYFLASDIDHFAQWKHELDDAVKQGRIDAIFEIFNTYRVRAHERIEYAQELLEIEPDFTLDEDYVFDRSELPWPDSAEELNEVWRKRIKNDALSLVLAGKEWPEVKELLQKRYARVLRRTKQLNSDEVFESFMNAYADALDPHSNYFSPRNSEEYRIQMSLSYEGIGASLQLTDDYVTVLDVIPGGPASITGLIGQNDRITAVGQGEEEELVDVIGWRLDDVVQLIRGQGGTIVRLQILPAGAAPGSPEKVVALTRDRIKLESQAAQKEKLEIDRDGQMMKVGVITVPSFYQDFNARQSGDKNYTSTTRDVRRLIEELEVDGLDGLIIDMRGNGGGHLSEARALSGLFIDRGPVVQLRDTGGRIEVLNDPAPDVAWDGPLAVLVDRTSASASEIFAAAIQDYERGVVIGQQTFGKGSVQNLYDLNHYARGTGMGQLTLTIGKYYRITGASTQLRGVEPDIAMPSSLDSTVIGESTRDTALPWDEIRPTRYSARNPLDPTISLLAEIHEQRTAHDPDFHWLRTQIATIDELRSKDHVSLNAEARKAEREKTRTLRLQFENERRVAHGLEPLATPEELDEVEPIDIVLREAAQIVVDLADADEKPTTATAAT